MGGRRRMPIDERQDQQVSSNSSSQKQISREIIDAIAAAITTIANWRAGGWIFRAKREIPQALSPWFKQWMVKNCNLTTGMELWLVLWQKMCNDGWLQRVGNGKGMHNYQKDKGSGRVICELCNRSSEGNHQFGEEEQWFGNSWEKSKYQWMRKEGRTGWKEELANQSNREEWNNLRWVNWWKFRRRTLQFITMHAPGDIQIRNRIRGFPSYFKDPKAGWSVIWNGDALDTFPYVRKSSRIYFRIAFEQYDSICRNQRLLPKLILPTLI